LSALLVNKDVGVSCKPCEIETKFLHGTSQMSYPSYSVAAFPLKYINTVIND